MKHHRRPRLLQTWWESLTLHDMNIAFCLPLASTPLHLHFSSLFCLYAVCTCEQMEDAQCVLFWTWILKNGYFSPAETQFSKFSAIKIWGQHHEMDSVTSTHPKWISSCILHHPGFHFHLFSVKEAISLRFIFITDNLVNQQTRVSISPSRN